jgi:serine/threonine protein kinase
MKALHDINILIRDLKASKILINNEENAIIIGLGSVKFIEDKRSNFDEQSGTPYSLSPECLDFKNHSKYSDIWQLGVLLYQLINCDFPFNIEEEQALYKQIKSGIFNKFRPNNYSEELLNLIRNMLNVEPH